MRLTGGDRREVPNRIPHHARGHTRKVEVERSAELGHDQRPDAALRQAELLQVVYLCKHLIAEAGQATVETLEVVLVATAEELLHVLNYHVARTPRLGEDGCSFHQAVPAVV